MTATIVHLGPRLHTPIGHVIRTDELSYRQYEHLHAEGSLPAKHVIVDASKARFQKEFIRALRDGGADVILDTKVAELSEVGRFQGMAKGAPWAATEQDRPLKPEDFQPDDFRPRANIDLFGEVARMAVELEVAAVMAPAHFLRNGGDDTWLPIDRAGVMRLRSALDREGGAAIAIDYPVILPHTRLQDGKDRARLMQALDGLPFDNLVLRLSGFGSNAMPLTVKRTFECNRDPARPRLSSPSRPCWGTGRTERACLRNCFGYCTRRWRAGPLQRTGLAQTRQGARGWRLVRAAGLCSAARAR